MSDVESDLEIIERQPDRSINALDDDDHLSPAEDIEEIVEAVELEAEVVEPDVESGAENDENKDNKPTKKKIVRNPQPKLDLERLKGSKGLTSLLDSMEKVKFKGDGNEGDLNLLWKNYEYWCHRMFPKLPFNACIDKLEKLGKQRGVQTLLKRIRTDMHLNDDVEPPEDLADPDSPNSPITQDPFDDMFPQRQVPITVTTPIEEALTAEQLERIRLNKEKARQIREAKLKAQETAVRQEIVDDQFEEAMKPSQRKRRRIDSSSDEETETASHTVSVVVDLHTVQNRNSPSSTSTDRPAQPAASVSMIEQSNSSDDIIEVASANEDVVD